MLLNRNTGITVLVPQTEPMRRALAALRRDMARCLLPTEAPGGEIRLQSTDGLPEECFALRADGSALVLEAGDTLGFVYGIYEISRGFLGVLPFWFWNDQRPTPCTGVQIPDNYSYASRPARVRWRGWFINDETLLMNWSYERRPEGPWEMAFETLLRLGGNLVIPGTDANARRYRGLAAAYGLAVTHHHAEPLGAEMFARAYPGLEARFDKHPEQFRALWKQAIREQAGMRVVWNIGFRGQGDRPFWEEDPQYDTPQKRGALMSRLIREQYDLVRSKDPAAQCCTNLYGETMELYKQGFLELPEDVIKIWADNGFGKMVSRRQGGKNPRVPALPPKGDGGAHGLYYHASFYDLQAASHITMLPNSAEFVRAELTGALAHGVDDYWLINCSNIKPHVYLLDLIASLWRGGDIDPAAHRRAYAAAYYGSAAETDSIAACLADYAGYAVPYGPHEDDHAGDQFYNHVPRMLMSQFMADRQQASAQLAWLTDAPALREQNDWIAGRFAQARQNYEAYLRECEGVSSRLTGAGRTLFADSILLQAQLYALWAQGGAAVCQSLDAAFRQDYKRAFWLAGCAERAYALADRAMRDREHGKWIDFYANECQTDVKQTAAVCRALMGCLRNLGEGPHFYEWQREFEDCEADRRVMLLLNTANHPTDAELWRLMEQRFGD